MTVLVRMGSPFFLSIVVGVCLGLHLCETYAMSHLNSSAVGAGVAAGEAEVRKRRKYAAIGEAYDFEPIAVETTGVYGESTASIIRTIGRRLVDATGEHRESSWFQQNLALSVQRGNAFSILSAGRERF